MPGAIGTPAAKPRIPRGTFAVILVVSAAIVGLALRWPVRGYATSDAILAYIPWCRYLHDHGIRALGDPFTNYAPFYSYLLLGAVQFDRFVEPLTLVKAMSVVFELGSAVVVTEMVWWSTKAPLRTALAFCGMWLAPTILINGAVWGQADSIWTFFVLLSVSLFMRHRNGTLPFALAISVKAQGVFLGPFVLGMMLRRRLNLAWLLAVPVVYLAVAVPVLVAGRAFSSVLGVYLAQAETFRALSMNAANLWIFADRVPYSVGVVAGMVVAAVAGGALSLFVARSRRDEPELVLLTACASLFLMPFLLPKMHDRYFYAFEVAAIALACFNPRYFAFAFLAQVNGILSCAAFGLGTSAGLLPATLCNSLLGCYLVLDLWNDERAAHQPLGAWIGCGAASLALLADVAIDRSASGHSPLSMVPVALFVSTAFLLLNGSRRERSCQPPTALESPALP